VNERNPHIFALSLVGLAVAAAGCGGGSSGFVPKGHSVNKTVSFVESYTGRTTVTVESAGTADSLSSLSSKPDGGKTFLFVTLSKFESKLLGPDDLLEVKASDGKLYSSAFSNGPDSGAALVDKDAIDPNHFSEVFEVPKGATKGAVLIVHERGIDRDPLDESYHVGRTPPEGYEQGAHKVDLGL
jgi:hypothetical protein